MRKASSVSPGTPIFSAFAIPSATMKPRCEGLSARTCVASRAIQRSAAFSSHRFQPVRVAHTWPVKIWVRNGTLAKEAASMASMPALGVTELTTA